MGPALMVGVTPLGTIRFAVTEYGPPAAVHVVFDASVPRDEALIVDLEHAPELGIRRSLKPSQLPRVVQDYLSPRQRVSYFFERVVVSDRPGA